MRDGLGETIQVAGTGDNAFFVNTDLVNDTDGAQAVDVDCGGAVDVRNLALTAGGVKAGFVVVLEETVESGT